MTLLTGPVTPSSDRPFTRRTRWRPTLEALLFVAPLVVLVLAFVYAPIVRLGFYSLTEYNGLRPAQWVGLDNFAFLVNWPDFHRAISNTFVLTLGLFLWVGLPFLLAVIIHGRRSANLVRAILFLPALLPALIVGRAFRLVLADSGPVNEALRGVGLGILAQPWLSSDTWVLPTIIVVIGWATMGTGVLLYTAGLSSLSKDYVEAALVDGARWGQLVWHIYRPALGPVTRFWLLLLTIGTVTSFFPWILGLTQGGPGTASVTLDYQVYRSGVQTSRLGLASAMAVVGVLVVCLLLSIQLLLRRFRGTDEW